jgi:uncharacterized protein
MANVLKELVGKKALRSRPQKFVYESTGYLTIMGSTAYAVNETNSDHDVYGWFMPPKSYVFPHLAGNIQGFGRAPQSYDDWQEHHIQHPDKDREYDFSMYSIVKYFQLCMGCNPNMIDSLFTPERCVLFTTAAGRYMKDNRLKFLHKGAWNTYRGYAYGQIKKIKNKKPTGKRIALVEKFGYDTKDAYHIVRLILQAEQIMAECDLDLERNAAILRSIRQGEWTFAKIEDYFDTKTKSLETVYANSKLRPVADEDMIKGLLLECLEMHYGNLASAVVDEKGATRALREISEILAKNSALLI